MHLLTPARIAIAAAVIAVVCVVWFAALRPTDERADAGRTYCTALQEKGLLLEPMSQCLAEYENATQPD